MLVETTAQLTGYFAGRRTTFDVPLDLQGGTPFQQSVWRALLAIPRGRTVSYGHLSRDVGNPAAVRAVGAAVGRKPVERGGALPPRAGLGRLSDRLCRWTGPQDRAAPAGRRIDRERASKPLKKSIGVWPCAAPVYPDTRSHAEHLHRAVRCAAPPVTVGLPDAVGAVGRVVPVHAAWRPTSLARCPPRACAWALPHCSCCPSSFGAGSGPRCVRACGPSCLWGCSIRASRLRCCPGRCCPSPRGWLPS